MGVTIGLFTLSRPRHRLHILHKLIGTFRQFLVIAGLRALAQRTAVAGEVDGELVIGAADLLAGHLDPAIYSDNHRAGKGLGGKLQRRLGQRGLDRLVQKSGVVTLQRLEIDIDDLL